MFMAKYSKTITTIKIIMTIHFVSKEEEEDEECIVLLVLLDSFVAEVVAEVSLKERDSAREVNGDESLLGGSDSSKRFM
jgi:hypothetical protein